jgi:hypothetical protein
VRRAESGGECRVYEVLLHEGTHERHTAEVLCQLGEVYLQLDRLDEAEALLLHCVRVCEEHEAPDTFLAQGER